MYKSSGSQPGALWRAVLNFIGRQETGPTLWLPLLEYASRLPSPETSYLDKLKRALADDADRSEILESIRFATIGDELWRTQSWVIVTWIRGANQSVTTEQVKSWWFGLPDWQMDSIDRSGDRVDDFLSVMKVRAEDHDFLASARMNPGHSGLLVYRLHQDLKWTQELDWLRELAEVTWPADLSQRQTWSEEQFAFVQEYYEQQQPELVEVEPLGESGIDPFSLRAVLYEQGLGFGMQELAYCLRVLIRATVIDFVQDVLDNRRFPGYRGSLRCCECGSFVARKPRGYSQQYCGERCKKRAAKRRYRSRAT